MLLSNHDIKASLIVPFYNKLHFFELVLASIKRQSTSDFELIIADDGSSEAVTSALPQLLEKLAIPHTYIWHEDTGWNKNGILNKAILAAKSPYLIFIDADCILHKDFVKAHIQNSEQGFMLAGRRVNLSKSITDKLTPSKIESGYLEKHLYTKHLWSLLTQSENHASQGLRLPSFIRQLKSRKNKGILGCNMSFWKEDLLKINGFDENYTQIGIGEDSDIDYRLQLSGIKSKSVSHVAIQYHLWHQFLKRVPFNLAYFETVKQKNEAWTPNGISKPQDISALEA